MTNGGWRYAAACNRPPIQDAPPGAVVMARVRGVWTVRGRKFPDIEAAQAYMDRVATAEGRPSWIET